MGVLRLSEAGIVDYQKYSNFLAGNQTFIPPSDDFLEEVILDSSASSVSFTGLDAYSDYKHLQIRVIARTDRTAFNRDTLAITINGDNSSVYSQHALSGSGANVSSSGRASDSEMYIGNISSNLDLANVYSPIVVDILDAFSSSKNTTIRAFTARIGSDPIFVGLQSGSYQNTNSVSSINWVVDSGSNFVAGSRFSLYGSRG